ncbi:MAG TPA: hypothetical protein VKY19_08605 [Ktedonosporobacter sp.]|nr:hypothetical protein [Ktedonosporobacter sp.]
MLILSVLNVLALIGCSQAPSPAPRSSVITEFVVSTPIAASNPNLDSPFMITTGPDGALWFTELTGYKIGRIKLPVPS